MTKHAKDNLKSHNFLNQMQILKLFHFIYIYMIIQHIT